MLLLAKVRLTQGWENPVRLDDFMYRQQRFSLTYLSIQLGTLIFKKLYCMSMLNFSEKNCEFAWIPEKLYVYRCLHKSFIGNLSLTYYFQSFYKYIYKRTFFSLFQQYYYTADMPLEALPWGGVEDYFPTFNFVQKEKFLCKVEGY